MSTVGLPESPAHDLEADAGPGPGDPTFSYPMSDFTDLVARAVNPTMSRAEREGVYSVVRQAVLRLQERENLEPGHPQRDLQLHLVEETIRDIESDVTRYESMRKLDEAFAAQAKAHKAGASGRR